MLTRRTFLEKSTLALTGFAVGLPLAGRAGGLPLANGVPVTDRLSLSGNSAGMHIDDGTLSESTPKPYRISLNTSTIRTYQLPVEKQIDVCGAAGFDGIELWISDIQVYLDKGGKLPDLAKRLKDKKLLLENIIGFAPWATDDDQQRKAGLLQMQQEMEMTAQLGGKYIAAPVMGIKRIDRAKLDEYSQRYRQILEIGRTAGVIPLLELWGGGALYNLADVIHIALGTNHPDANLLLDFYHLYRGGNSLDALKMLNVTRLPLFHINDYPASPPRAQLNDSDRVYPGDGICPFQTFLPYLFKSGFTGGFSVELFNEGYCKQHQPEQMLSITLEKTKHLITNSL